MTVAQIQGEMKSSKAHTSTIQRLAQNSHKRTIHCRDCGIIESVFTQTNKYSYTDQMFPRLHPQRSAILNDLTPVWGRDGINVLITRTTRFVNK